MVDSASHSRFLNPWKLHLQKLGLELKCPLCLVLFKTPVLLPCNHIFCKSCVSTSNQFRSECLVCKAPYLSRELRAAPYIENLITIYRSMEATLNACLTHSGTGRVSGKQAASVTAKFALKLQKEPFEAFQGNLSCGPFISSLCPNKRIQATLNHSVEDGFYENENLAPSHNGDKEFENCNFETQNMNQVTQLSFGSLPSSGDTNGLDDDKSDQGSEHSLQKHSAKRSGERSYNNRTGQEKNGSFAAETEQDHMRDLKRQKRLNFGRVGESMKSDVCYQGVGSDYVGLEPNSGGSLCGEQLHSIPDSSDGTKTACAFCQSCKLSEATGEMLHYANGKPVAGDDAYRSHVIHVHRQCIDWAPQVYYVGETVKNLDAELARGAKLKCSSCGLKGAALGCYAKSCRRSYHIPCAIEVLDCRWDCENFLLLCPSHSSLRFPNEKSKHVKHDSKKRPVVDPLETKTKPEAPASMTTEQSKFWAASLDGVKEWVLCGSALSAEEKFLLIKFAGMSGITVSKVWKPNVTHVIAATDVNGACTRTLKVLMAILHGKWILTIDWIKACTEAMRPVDEEPYEVTTDNHGCRDGPKTGRLRVLANGPKLLNRIQFYFSGDFLLNYKQDLQNLVRAAGGIVLESKEKLIQQVYDSVTTSTLVVYNLDTSQGCKVGEENSVVLQRIREAEELAAETRSRVIGHTRILESIAACKLQPLLS